jgi:FAD/FMN-containing dehydrogenase
MNKKVVIALLMCLILCYNAIILPASAEISYKTNWESKMSEELNEKINASTDSDLIPIWVDINKINEDELNNLIEQASEIVLEAGAIDVLVADTPAKIKDAWAARSSFLEAIMAETKLLDECDVVVPVNKIAPYLAFVNKTGEECGINIKSFGHAGDGNLHIYQCSNDLEEAEFKARVDKFFKIIYQLN